MWPGIVATPDYRREEGVYTQNPDRPPLRAPLAIATRSYSLASIVLQVQEAPSRYSTRLKRLQSVAQSPRNYHYFFRKRSGLQAVTIYSQSRGTMAAIWEESLAHNANPPG
jgi:hypothetical protein